MEKERYILYGIGGEAERFLYQNQDILGRISFCIDRNTFKNFYDLKVYKLDEINVCDYLETHHIIVAAGNIGVYREMKECLVVKGLEEWKDFIWSQTFRRKVVVINANCHGIAVEWYLRQSAYFCNKYMIYPIPAVQMNKEGEIGADLLQHTDVYIHQDIRAENAMGYKLSDEYVRSFLPENVIDICIPNFVGMGRWMFPSLGGLEKVIEMDGGGVIYVLFRDAILDEAAAMYHSYDEIKEYWLNYKYDAEQMDHIFLSCMQKLKEREKNWDVKIFDYIMENYRTIPCFTDASHPSKYVMKLVCRQIAQVLNLNDIDDENYEPNLGLKVPVMNSILEYYKLNFQLPCESRKEYLGKWTVSEPDDYIKAYLWWYHQIQTDGVKN